MSVLDSRVVQAVAEALAEADWTNYGTRPDDWEQLPEAWRTQKVWAQIPAARVAVAAMEGQEKPTLCPCGHPVHADPCGAPIGEHLCVCRQRPRVDAHELGACGKPDPGSDPLARCHRQDGHEGPHKTFRGGWPPRGQAFGWVDAPAQPLVDNWHNWDCNRSNCPGCYDGPRP